jgi:hypothetical protein
VKASIGVHIPVEKTT